MVPGDVQEALKAAMSIEQVPATDFDDLLWIVAQEFGGVVMCETQNRQPGACANCWMLKPT